MLEIGMKAPNFTLKNQNDEPISLSDFSGKRVVLYFYPRDNTPGCTKQACGYAGAYDAYSDKDVVVIGISKDTVSSHKKFVDKYELPFILLADPELETIKAYGAWAEKKLYGKLGFGVSRITYIIGVDGTIEYVMPKVKADTNAADILKDLETL